MDCGMDEFVDASENLDDSFASLSGSPCSKEFSFDAGQACGDDVKAVPSEQSHLKQDEVNKDPNSERQMYEDTLTEEERQTRRTASLELKETGNSFFKDSVFSEALSNYSTALDKCPLVYTKNRSILFSNRAACQYRLGNLDAALSDCDQALKLQPDYIKCLQRRAEFREEKELLGDALEDYQHLLKLNPALNKARCACMTLPGRIQKQQEEMKEKMMDQLKQLGNLVLKPFGLSTDNFKVQKNPDSEGYSVNLTQ